MKVRTSYFYQIRNFTHAMIPISTALWDPKWYHDFTNNYNYIFKDKRNILNGIRCNTIIEQGRRSNTGTECCPCKNKNYTTCSFLCNYKNNLNTIDFDKFYKDIQQLAEDYKRNENIQEEIIVVFIVYETPDNPCSERQPLIDFFNSHGIECQELDYPIQKLSLIKDDSFDF